MFPGYDGYWLVGRLSVDPHFFVFPSMGLGVFGRRSPEGIRSPLSSLANHLFYGVGMAVAVALV